MKWRGICSDSFLVTQKYLDEMYMVTSMQESLGEPNFFHLCLLLFNVAFCNSDFNQYVLGRSLNTELGTVWKEVVVPWLEGCFDMCMEEVNKTTELPTGGYSVSGLRYEPVTLQMQSRNSVHLTMMYSFGLCCFFLCVCVCVFL